MLEIVRKTIAENNMLSKDDKILVALSGGCDSISLSLSLMELGYNIAVAHVNHCIRDTAERDENFVVDFATKYNIPFHITKINVPEMAKTLKISEESAGRKARYDFFEQICSEYGYNKIAVAHNLNDTCETFLMNLMRGTGIKGLCGIPKVRGKIVRPLIEVPRLVAEQFVKSRNEEYVEDETNMLTEYTRNKVRHNIIPEFLEINPKFMENLSRTAKILSEDSEFITKCAEDNVEKKKNFSMISKEKFILLEDALKREALMIAYTNAAGTNKDFEKKHIDYIIETVKNKEHGNIIDLCFGVSCHIKYGKIIFEKNSKTSDYEYNLNVNGEIIIDEADLKISARIIDKSGIDYNIPCCEYFDYDKIGTDIVVRNRKTGDRIVPFGTDYSKKVKEILINQKIEAKQRNILPLFVTDRIFWIYNVKRSNDYKVDDNTVNVLMIQGIPYSGK